MMKDKKQDLTAGPGLAAKTTGIPVQTGIRVGELSDLGESLFFGLLDALQKPTDWLYDLIVAPKHGL